MAEVQFESFSPAWFVHHLDRIIHHVCQPIHRTFKGSANRGAVGLMILAGLIFAFSYQIPIPDRAQMLMWFVTHTLRAGCVLMAGFSILSLISQGRWNLQSDKSRLVAFLLMTAAVVLIFPHRRLLWAFAEAAMSLMLVSLTLLAATRRSPRLFIFTFILVLVLAVLGPAKMSVYFATNRLNLPDAIRSPIFFVLLSLPFAMEIMAHGLNVRPALQILGAIFSPLQVVSYFPTTIAALPETQSERSQLAENFSKAFNNLAAGLLVGLCALATYKNLPMSGAIENGKDVFVKGWSLYLFRYFFWLSILRTAFGCAVLLGYKFPEPADHALFAVNPLDRWKRWDFIFYSWSFAYVFLPVMRKTKKPILAIAVVFMILFLSHNPTWISSAIFFPGRRALSLLFLDRQFHYYVMQAVSLIFGYSLRRFWPAMESRRGWLGVLATHALMAVTHATFIW